MSQQSAQGEPSMEDILSSIRRIITDEDDSSAKTAQAPAAKTADAQEAISNDIDFDSIDINDMDFDSISFDDEPSQQGSLAEEPEVTAAAEEDDVFELGEELIEEEFEGLDEPLIHEDISFAEDEEPIEEVNFEEPEPVAQEAPVPQPAPVQMPVPAPAPQSSSQNDLMSQATQQVVSNAFASLANTIFTHDAKTIEDVIKELLRPMLKSWIDDNLPAIVERLVKEEIERVSKR